MVTEVSNSHHHILPAFLAKHKGLDYRCRLGKDWGPKMILDINFSKKFTKIVQFRDRLTSFDLHVKTHSNSAVQ